MENNELKKINTSNINLGLGFGIFSICSSLIFVWMMYFFPIVTPPLRLFLFPFVGCVFGIHAILDSYKKYYISDRLLGFSFILFGITFFSIFNNISWPGIIILILFIIVGTYQLFTGGIRK